MPAPNRASRRNAARTERIRNIPAPRELDRVRANRTFTPGHRGRR